MQAFAEALAGPRDSLTSHSGKLLSRQSHSVAATDQPVGSLDLSCPVWLPPSPAVSNGAEKQPTTAAVFCNAAGSNSDDSEGRKRPRRCWEHEVAPDQSHLEQPAVNDTLHLQVNKPVFPPGSRQRKYHDQSQEDLTAVCLHPPVLGVCIMHSPCCKT